MNVLARMVRSAFGWRMLVHYVGVALVPIVALASLFYLQVNASLQRSRDQEIGQAAHAYADTLKERLLAAEREFASAAAAGSGAVLPTALADAGDGPFQAAALIGATGRRIDGHGYTGDLPKIDGEVRQKLDAGHDVAVLTEGRHARVALLRATRATGPERVYLAAVIDPAYLAGDPKRTPMQIDFCAMSGEQIVAGCSRLGAAAPRTELIDHASHGSDDVVAWHDGDDRFRSSAATLSFDSVSTGPMLVIIATQPESYALAPTRSTGSHFIWITAVVALVAIGFAARQVQRVVEPLDRLVAGTRRIAQQDFTSQIAVHGHDEFAQLASAYNEMARSLGMNFATLSVLSQIDRTILTKPDVGEVVRSALRYVRYTTAVDLAVFGLFEGTGEKTMRLYALRAHGRSRLDGAVVQLPHEVRQRLTTMPGTSWVDNPPLPADIQLRLANEDGVRHFWVQPVARADRLWGVMVLGHSSPPPLSPSQLTLLSGVADRLEVAFATVERDRKLHTMAHVDALTGLPNRTALLTLLSQELAHAHRNHSCVGVLFLDLDRFKQANDTLGHAVGDMLLQRAAERIRHNVREDDTVARLGGDEFTIVLGGLASGRDAGSVARQLIKAISRPFEIEGHLIHVGASVGISIYPGDGTEGNDLLKKADTAMYRAKDEGRNRFAFYEEDMNVEARRRATLDRELRHALKHDEFVLHYQPQIELATGQVCAVEALVRWRHPERGLLYPDAFITFAEENGLIPEIGTWVMREACLQHQRWRAAGIPIPRVSVNVSNDQLNRPNFVRTVLYLLNLAQMPRGSIEIEVTESMFLEGGKTALDALNALVDAGVKVAIDDFGTGYSSFGYLKTLPASVLKLDKSFLKDAATDNDAGTIIAAMINMAHTLRKEVVAEGVEREWQLEFLRGLGCEKVQGYLYSKPIPADDIARYAQLRSEQYPAVGDGSASDDDAQLCLDLKTEWVLEHPVALPAPRGTAAPASAAPRTRRAVDFLVESDDPGGDIEVVELDENLLEENVMEPSAGDRGWQALWTAPATVS
jgi:diguanylate cyclase (GGDEF)-like protein